MNNTSQREIHSSQPLRVITLAHAARRSNTAPPKDQTPLLCQVKNNSISSKVKDIINKHKLNSAPSTSQPHMPSGRLYSKVATRKRPAEPVLEEPHVDLDYLRSLKLEPPSWVNKPNQRSRLRPTQLDSIRREMKQRCAEMKVNAQDGKIFPLKKSNPNKHNGLCKETSNQRAHLIMRDENPLGFDETSSPGIETPSVSLREDRKPEFVWNPVIVKNDNYTNIFAYLGSSSKADSPHSIRQSPYNNQRHMNFGVNNDSRYSNYDHQFPTPSSSSGSTVAEEALNTRFQARFCPRSAPQIMWSPKYGEDVYEEPRRHNPLLESPSIWIYPPSGVNPLMESPPF